MKKPAVSSDEYKIKQIEFFLRTLSKEELIGALKFSAEERIIQKMSDVCCYNIKPDCPHKSKRP